MILAKTLKTIEFDKVLSMLAEFGVLERTKASIIDFLPVTDIKEAEFLLKKTEEAYKLLYVYSIGGVFYCSDIDDELKRVDKGGTLNNGELLAVAENLKSARVIKSAIASVNDQSLSVIPQISQRLYVNLDFEKEIYSKIISQDEISDSASPRLYSIRKNIRDLNAKIRDKLNSYIRGGTNKYLQDSVVTMRQDRYVIPVKSEFRSQIKGFIHDQSSSGSTVFIEPEQVMEYNNELKRAKFDEADEIYRILVELTGKVSYMTDALRYNAENLVEIDNSFARAQYSFVNKCSKPILNDKGVIDIKRGKHPLISKEKVVPISLNIGKDYNFLLITGPNTGGKTVTLKLVGLISVMAMSGLYIPADDDSEVSVFNGVYCDVGDEQSIEQDLSTFSSHIKNLIDIINCADRSSLVLLDEIGAGTDPEEGSALALAIIKKLLELNSYGIITTHYSRLKEYAMENGKIQNASMEFDSVSLKPLYKINIGIPGSSNAIDIAKTLGLGGDIIAEALKNLSTDKISFEKVLKKAEDSRRECERLSVELEDIKEKRQRELNEISAEKEKIVKERERIYSTAKQETKRIVADKLADAEEIIYELKSILKRANLESKEVFRASELKNRLQNSRYLDADIDAEPFELIKADKKDLKIGNKVYIKTLGTYAKLLSVKPNFKEAEVLIGDIKTVVKVSDIFNSQEEEKQKNNVKIFKQTYGTAPQSRLNVVGKTSLEAVQEVENFIDQAVVHGIEEITVIHGVGEGILLKSIREYLKKDKNVAEFRRGKYGEGENGVTIIKLK